MMALRTDVNLTPEIIDQIAIWQDGEAEGWIEILQQVIRVVIRSDEEPAELLALAGELLNLQDELRPFTKKKEINP